MPHSTASAAPTAALAGIPAGLQAQGLWAGRRQVFVRFAAEAETATMYTVDALTNELRRATERSAFHSIAIAGRDPLANVEYLRAAFGKFGTGLPIMLDGDGQRPQELAELRGVVGLAQVTLDGSTSEATAERALETLGTAAACAMEHALVICVDDRTTDGHVLRMVERAHAASGTAAIVVHPPLGMPLDRDRRWITLFERATALHRDVRFVIRLPAPTGMR